MLDLLNQSVISYCTGKTFVPGTVLCAVTVMPYNSVLLCESALVDGVLYPAEKKVIEYMQSNGLIFVSEIMFKCIDNNGNICDISPTVEALSVFVEMAAVNMQAVLYLSTGFIPVWQYLGINPATAVSTNANVGMNFNSAVVKSQYVNSSVAFSKPVSSLEQKSVYVPVKDDVPSALLQKSRALGVMDPAKAKQLSEEQKAAAQTNSGQKKGFLGGLFKRS